MDHRTAALLAALLAASCGADDDLTEIVLVVDTDLAVGVDVDAFEMVVEGPSETTEPLVVPLTGPDAAALPFSIGLVAAGPDIGELTVKVSALLRGAPVVARTARARFVAGEVRRLDVALRCRCRPVTCPADQTCGDDGLCVDERVSELPPWNGAVERRFGCEGPESRCREPVELTAGSDAACVRRRSGELACWGGNYEGERGDGTPGDRDAPAQPVPSTVSTIVDATDVDAGKHIACALHGCGAGSCWGRNDFGALADGTRDDSAVPSPIAGLDDGVVVSTGGSHTCVLHSAGTVSCAGFFIELGIDASCACWGSGGAEPGCECHALRDLQPIPNVVDVVALDSSGTVTCAAGRDGTVWCWGTNSAGELGIGRTTGNGNAPEPVVGVSSAVGVDAGGKYACVLENVAGGRQVRCWGRNTNGQLGDGTNTDRLAPGPAVELVDPVQISAGGQTDYSTPDAVQGHTCALLGDGAVRCWGDNTFGQLGDGTTVHASSPRTVTGLPTGDRVKKVRAGYAFTCVRLASARVFCWGTNDVGQLARDPAEVSSSTTPLQIPLD